MASFCLSGETARHRPQPALIAPGTGRTLTFMPAAMSTCSAVMTADQYRICGRAAFKEEFVTCGGVSLSSVDLGTLECRSVPGLYCAGEVLDIDAVTGGFNLQAAWSCAYLVACALA